MRADLSQPAAHAGHAGHAGAATRGTPPPCHGPQTLVKAPCACGCEERAAASSAQLDAGLKPAPPQVEWLALARRHDPPALLVGEVDLAGVDPVPRPA